MIVAVQRQRSIPAFTPLTPYPLPLTPPARQSHRMHSHCSDWSMTIALLLGLESVGIFLPREPVSSSDDRVR